MRDSCCAGGFACLPIAVAKGVLLPIGDSPIYDEQSQTDTIAPHSN